MPKKSNDFQNIDLTIECQKTKSLANEYNPKARQMGC